jgi:uncharacterized protein YggU (UPF0235/DUF167 family)
MSVRERTVATRVLLRLRVVTGARHSEVVGRLGEAWKVRVDAVAERGRANDEVVRLLARALGLPRQAVRIVRGHTANDKLVEVEGVSREEAERRLDRAGRRE